MLTVFLTPFFISLADQESLNALGLELQRTSHALLNAEHLKDFLEEDFAQKCRLIPELIPAPLAVITNPARIFCEVANSIRVHITYAFLVAATIANQVLDVQYGDATRGPNQEMYSYYYARATYLNTKVKIYGCRDSFLS